MDSILLNQNQNSLSQQIRLTKNLAATINYYIHLCILFRVNNILTHTKQFAFHASNTSGVYSVCFDVFRYLARRGF
jgi:hypothetical protein